MVREEKHVDRSKEMNSDSVRAPAGSDGTEEAILENLEQEQRLKCLDKCMSQLEADERELIVQYYLQEKRLIDRILNRFNFPSKTALYVKVLRIKREKLEPCLRKCLGYVKNSERKSAHRP